MTTNKSIRKLATAPAFVFLILALAPAVCAQSPELKQKLADIKAASAANKQALAQYMWQEQQSISLKGEVKKTVIYQVQTGPDGKPNKTQISEQPQPSDNDDSGGGRRGRLKEHVKEKKISEYKEYGQQMSALLHSYAQPDSQRMQQAAQQGNVTMGPLGTPGQVQLVIKNYVKPNDQLTLVFDTQAKALLSVSVNSYLNDPSDAVKMQVQYAQIPGGPNHVSTATVDGVSKNMTVAIINSNYQKM